ncbi:unnamed protein product [Amoebophrya sp. A120]|nr:unnamed protein product [Amoebophrya sp. A120]|eukprot:GSA120T00009937001.1
MANIAPRIENDEDLEDVKPTTVAFSFHELPGEPEPPQQPQPPPRRSPEMNSKIPPEGAPDHHEPPPDVHYSLLVGPKTFFAQERTFLHWMHVCVLVGGLVLFKFDKKNVLSISPAALPPEDYSVGDDKINGSNVIFNGRSSSSSSFSFVGSKVSASAANLFAFCLLLITLCFTVWMYVMHRRRMAVLQTASSNTGTEFREIKFFLGFGVFLTVVMVYAVVRAY